MKGIICLVASSLLIGCYNKPIHKTVLEESRLINTVFDKSEIADLRTMLDFFNEQIRLQHNVENASLFDSYQSFFKRMEESEETGDIDVKIPFEKQMEMYSQLSENTFNQIWTVYDDGASRIINIYGKYVDFLRQLGKRNRTIRNYHESIINCGDISPGNMADVLLNYSNYDVRDVKIQLIIAIHYLSWNEQREWYEKYYEQQ